jgi:hypothetical protein
MVHVRSSLTASVQAAQASTASSAATVRKTAPASASRNPATGANWRGVLSRTVNTAAQAGQESAASGAGTSGSQPSGSAAPAVSLPASTVSASPTASQTAANSSPCYTIPTIESTFGANAFCANPTQTAPDGQALAFNPIWFATPQTAAKVAQLLGGAVVEKNDMTGDNGVFSQSQVNEMVKLPNGRLVNAGLIASYYGHGFSQSQIADLLNTELSTRG